MAIPSAADVVTVTTPHGRVRVRDTGSTGSHERTEPVLLLHPVLTDPDLYAPLVPLLAARGLRCLLPELPLGGHALPVDAGVDLTPPGLADLVAEVLDALGVARAHVVGCDTGGAITQLLMARHPERVGSVVLTPCDAYDSFPPRSVRPLLAVLRAPGVLPVLGRLARLRAVRRLVTVRMLTHAGTDDATVQRWLAPLRDPAARRDLRAVLRAVEPRHTLAAAVTNRRFPRPVLVAWGDDDRVFPRRLAERLVADLPDARLVVLDDCAAFAPLDRPVELADLVVEHLAAARPAPTL